MRKYAVQYSKILRFRITKEMDQRIYKEAEKMGIKVSEYLRWLIRKEFEIVEPENAGWKYIEMTEEE